MNGIFAFLKRYLLALIVLVLLILAAVYYFYWHLKPFTQNAFVFANTRAVTPLVAGYITDIYVTNNQFVRKGEPLFRIYCIPYRLTLETQEAQLKKEEALLKAMQEELSGAKADIRAVQAELANNRYLSGKAKKMYQGEAVSQAYNEERLRAREASEARLDSTRHKAAALEHSCSAALSGIHALKKQIALSRIWLSQTTVYALSDGYVTNMSITPGGYYRPGDVLFGFIDSSVWYVQANFKENELSGVRPGLAAKIWLWQYPEQCFHGIVESSGWSTERRKSAGKTGLPVVSKENEWFLLPQRFPVQIRILDPDPELIFHHGASAYVEIDVPSRPIRQFFWELFLWTKK